MMTEVSNATVEKKVVNLDEILMKEVGPCGKFQLMLLTLCCLTAIVYGQTTNSYLFTIAQIKTRCIIPECENSSSSPLNLSPSWILNAIPAAASSFDNCHRYANNSSSANTSETCSADLFDRNSLTVCEEFIYEHKNSAVYEYDLACDDWRPYLVGFGNVLGLMLSLPMSGFVADRWGRRVALAVTTFNSAWIGSLKYFAPSYTSFFFISLAEAVFGASSFSCAYILAIEYTGVEHRVIVGSIVGCFSSVGRIITSLIAWSDIYWRYLILVIHVPPIITIAYFWIAPESVRWLMSKGRYDEAKDMLKMAAEMNGNALSEDTLASFSEAKQKRAKKFNKPEPWLVCLVFKHRPILFRCMMTSIWWISCLLVYYGLLLSSVQISGNKYFNFCAAAAMMILGYCLAIILLNKVGRKPLLIAGFWLSGICQYIYIFIPNGYYWLSLSVYMAGMLFISCCMLVLYVYTAELYPTPHRASLFAFSSMVGRFGNLLAPLSPALAAEVWEHLPFVLFGGMVFLSGLLVLLAPETLGTKLPDTMEEAVAIGQHTTSPFQRLFRKKCYNVN